MTLARIRRSIAHGLREWLRMSSVVASSSTNQAQVVSSGDKDRRPALSLQTGTAKPFAPCGKQSKGGTR